MERLLSHTGDFRIYASILVLFSNHVNISRKWLDDGLSEKKYVMSGTIRIKAFV
jgi:hypothetical protein